MLMTELKRPVSRAPAFVRWMDPVVRRLLRIGFPMGPNRLITIRGRTSGQPRSAGVAMVETDERRWVISAFGETHWVRNLRAAGEALIQVRGHDEPMRAVELSQAEAVVFFSDTLSRYIRSLSPPARLVSRIFTADIFADPVTAAARRPVFELLAREP